VKGKTTGALSVVCRHPQPFSRLDGTREYSPVTLLPDTLSPAFQGETEVGDGLSALDPGLSGFVAQGVGIASLGAEAANQLLFRSCLGFEAGDFSLVDAALDGIPKIIPALGGDEHGHGGANTRAQQAAANECADACKESHHVLPLRTDLIP
jgi:hypothetical protein